MMNKSGQGVFDFSLVALALLIGFGGLIYNNHVRINNEEEQSLYSYIPQITQNLRKVDYDRLDFVVPQEKRLTKDGKAYYQIVLGEESTHKDNKRTRTAHIKVELKNSKTFIEKTVILSSDKNDYKDIDVFEEHNTNTKAVNGNNIRIETEVIQKPNKYTGDRNSENEIR